MIRRIEFWQRALLGIGLALALAAPAQALITVEGRQSATLQWAASTGPVAGYYVILGDADGGLLTYYSTVVGRTWETITVPYNQVFTVCIAAFDASGRGSPISEMSEPIVFVPAADPPPATDPPPDPDPPPATEPPPEDDPPPVEDADPAFDFDDDGASDLLVQGGWRKDLQIWSMDADGVAGVADLTGAGRYAEVVGNGDYDGDGVADILWRDSRSYQVSLFFMDAGSVRESVVVKDQLAPLWHIVGSGDYDGDGASDLLVYTPFKNQFRVWTIDASGGFEYSVLPSDFRDEAEVIASGDFDGDGMADILWRHPPSGDVDIWGLTGDHSLGSFEEDEPSWEIIGAGDFDGDGRDDLLLREPSSNRLAVRLSTRGVRDPIDYENNAASSDRQVVAMGDYDGDGRTDLVVYDGSSVWVWYLNGSQVIRGRKIDSPAENWDFVSVDQRKPGSR